MLALLTVSQSHLFESVSHSSQTLERKFTDRLAISCYVESKVCIGTLLSVARKTIKYPRHKEISDRKIISQKTKVKLVAAFTALLLNICS